MFLSEVSSPVMVSRLQVPPEATGGAKTTNLASRPGHADCHNQEQCRPGGHLSGMRFQRRTRRAYSHAAALESEQLRSPRDWFQLPHTLLDREVWAIEPVHKPRPGRPWRWTVPASLFVVAMSACADQDSPAGGATSTPFTSTSAGVGPSSPTNGAPSSSTTSPPPGVGSDDPFGRNASSLPPLLAHVYSADPPTLVHAQEIAIQDCMTRSGFAYEAAPASEMVFPRPFWEQEFGLLDPANASKNGYHIGEFTKPSGGHPPSNDPAYNRALYGENSPQVPRSRTS